MLDFEIDPEPLGECLTAYGGLSLVSEAYRALGVRDAVARHVQVKIRQRGLAEPEMVEAFLLLLAAGGECNDDFQKLHEDAGLAAQVGFEMPSPDAALKFLYRFHDEELVKARPVGQLAFVPEESTPLQQLATVNALAVAAVGKRMPAEMTSATVDLDGSVIESHKREATWTYDNQCGYQPLFAVWAETGLCLADEFRDGNVTGMQDPLTTTKAAFAALRPVLAERPLTLGFRGDSACHHNDLLAWLRDQQRPDGPAGFIRFAVSARMSKPLQQACAAVPEAKWKAFVRPDGQAQAEDADLERQWVDLDNYVSMAGSFKKNDVSDRYIAIRIRKRQRELFEDGSQVKHFAIVTNDMQTDGCTLLHWQRQKAGTIEQLHDILQNGLGLGTYPCGRFGANAAWQRLNVLAHNLLQGIKRLALDDKLQNMHPKRMRFLLFTLPGRVVRSGRQMWLRLAASAGQIARLVLARLRLWQLTPALPAALSTA